MSRRKAVLSAGFVFLFALAVRAWAASLIVFPKPEDTAYYVSVARNLLDGRGLVSDAIWSYQTPPLVFPRPAFEVWLPLPTFLVALPMALFGPSFGSAQVASVLVGALVPVLAWRIGADVANELRLPVGRARTLALGAGLTSAVHLGLVLHSALPDSTMPFTVLALAACLCMSRLARGPGNLPLSLPGLVALGVLIGAAALTRNEAMWIGATWAAIAWWTLARPARERLRAIAVPAFVAIAVFAPWAVRDWAAFGSPFPGQAVSNALSLDGTDIFAWSQPPTLARYLDAGIGRLVELRLTGFGHNLFDVLVFLGLPVAVLGLVALPWVGRRVALRPLLVYSAITFLGTCLLFPVSTTWGTFLHAAGPVHVLLTVSALVALDGAIAWVGRRRGWTRPVAWLGPTFAVAGALLFTVATLPSFGASSAFTRNRYDALGPALAAAGARFDADTIVISDNPIWIAAATPARGLALPAEPPSSVRALAAEFGATLLVLGGGVIPSWPATLSSGDPAAACFHPLTLPPPASAAQAEALRDVRVWSIACP
jgi:hypothetical protein